MVTLKEQWRRRLLGLASDRRVAVLLTSPRTARLATHFVALTGSLHERGVSLGLGRTAEGLAVRLARWRAPLAPRRPR